MDWIEGPVTQIVDGDTFDMQVEWVGESNSSQYNNEERIRVRGVDAPEVGTAGAAAATEALRKRFGGQYVHCDVHTRDTYSRLVCDVRVAQRRQAS